MLADARDQLDAVSAFHARRGEFYDQAWAQNNIGMAFYYEGRYDEAIRAYQKSLPLYARLHERTRPGPGSAESGPGRIRARANVRVHTSLPPGAESHHARRKSEVICRRPRQQRPGKLGQRETTIWRCISTASRWRWPAPFRTRPNSPPTFTISPRCTPHWAIRRVRWTSTDRLSRFSTLRKTFAAAPRHFEPMANILRQQGHAEEALKMDREALSLAPNPAVRPRITVQIAKDLIELGRLQGGGADSRDRPESERRGR